jgi:8-oxo-dGTP diphosphatase
MWYCYILQSQKDKRTYVGYTGNLQERLLLHNQGKVKATKRRRPFMILYTEELSDLALAKKRELYWKSSAGRRKLKEYFMYGFPPRIIGARLAHPVGGDSPRPEMEKNLAKNIEVISRAFIVRDGRVLLCKVKSKDNWFFPGGHVEFGETAEEALDRELKEEIGANLKGISFVGVCENTFQFLGKEHQEVNLVFEAQIENNKGEKIAVLEDHMEFDWFPADELESVNVLPEKLKNEFSIWLKEKKFFYAK